MHRSRAFPVHLPAMVLVTCLALAPASAQSPAAARVPETSPSLYLAKLAAARIPADAAGAVVLPLDGGSLAFAANGQKPMNPASTMKLVTTYSALHLLGPAFTFHTDVLAEGPLAGDVLRG
ncbi:MAG TPA: D-alanyl-D-alanine carboxypeptidase, partial [Burkholderiales bacterium]|nr:D-alanyl-D-alanine carboxypeptidase [Burkholderiales bacterium]